MARQPFPAGSLSGGDDFHFRGDDWSLGGNAGLLWQPHPMHSFGVTYFSPSNFDFQGESHLQYKEVAVDVPVAPGVTEAFCGGARGRQDGAGLRLLPLSRACGPRLLLPADAELEPGS